MRSPLARQAETEAQGVLETVWAEDNQIRLPIDPVQIAKAFNIETYDAELDDNVSGAIVKEGDGDPVILLNQNDHENRKRFSCAHELGHYVRRLNSLSVSGAFEYVDFRGQLATKGTDPDEVYANNFAAALLMPERQVQFFHKAGLKAAELTYIFEVSAEAIELRLKNLNIRT
jgi:Zn-dependent peptidase ImmA (M78 family)